MKISRATRYVGFFLGALVLSSNLYAEEGVPPAEWTPQEQKFVGEMRTFYQKQGRPLTDEEASIAVKAMRERIARMTGQMAGLQAGLPMALGAAGSATAQAAPAALPTSGEEEMGARYAQIPAKTGDVEIEGRKDGFVVNGRPYLDPEGTITD